MCSVVCPCHSFFFVVNTYCPMFSSRLGDAFFTSVAGIMHGHDPGGEFTVRSFFALPGNISSLLSQGIRVTLGVFLVRPLGMNCRVYLFVVLRHLPFDNFTPGNFILKLEKIFLWVVLDAWLRLQHPRKGYWGLPSSFRALSFE